MAKKKVIANSEVLKLDKEKAKLYMKECEKKYKESFKGDSCKAIMDAYYEWEWAKKCYYKNAGIEEVKQENESVDEEELKE